jgi:hypothetical protein
VLPAAIYDALVTNGLNNLGGTAQTADHTVSISNIDTVVDLIKSDTTSILTDTNELQANQGNWLTATGFNTVTPPSVSQFNARTVDSADYFLVSDYTAPDNASITSILADTNELQLNQSNWLTATGFSTSAEIAALNNITASDVWLSATRTLTAGTNIVLSKGVGITGFNDIAATDIVTGGAITTSGGNASVDVVKINGTTVIGAGNSGDLWRA